jgi:hypothetical protein
VVRVLLDGSGWSSIHEDCDPGVEILETAPEPEPEREGPEPILSGPALE